MAVALSQHHHYTTATTTTMTKTKRDIKCQPQNFVACARLTNSTAMTLHCTVTAPLWTFVITQAN